MFVCLFFFVSFFCSESVKELKSGSCKLSQSSIEQNESGYEDEEQGISEYLTLLQLGLILRELAVKGRNMTLQRWKSGVQVASTRRLKNNKIT